MSDRVTVKDLNSSCQCCRKQLHTPKSYFSDLIRFTVKPLFYSFFIAAFMVCLVQSMIFSLQIFHLRQQLDRRKLLLCVKSLNSLHIFMFISYLSFKKKVVAGTQEARARRRQEQKDSAASCLLYAATHNRKFYVSKKSFLFRVLFECKK